MTTSIATSIRHNSALAITFSPPILYRKQYYFVCNKNYLSTQNIMNQVCHDSIHRMCRVFVAAIEVHVCKIFLLGMAKTLILQGVVQDFSIRDGPNSNFIGGGANPRHHLFVRVSLHRVRLSMAILGIGVIQGYLGATTWLVLLGYKIKKRIEGVALLVQG